MRVKRMNPRSRDSVLRGRMSIRQVWMRLWYESHIWEGTLLSDALPYHGACTLLSDGRVT